MLIAETYPFSRKLSGKRKFREKRKFSRNEISRKFAHFRIVFDFRENEKNRFRFNPSLSPLAAVPLNETFNFIPFIFVF
jgi:hypothetical protein